MSGIVSPPYFSHATGQSVTARVRRDRPEIENGREKNKYISAYGDRKHLYFPTGAAAKLQDADTPVVLVEAEKSSLALTAWASRTEMNLVAVAMGGCWGWRGRIGKVENAEGERVDQTGPVSDLDCIIERKVYVLLDVNVVSNLKVQQAPAALVRELCTRNCEVFVCDLPAAGGVNGPDDYTAACGDGAMAKVLTDARAAVASCDYGGGRFEISNRGVIYIGPPDKDGNAKPPLWICAPLHAVAMTRDNKSGEWGRLLEWQDKDGVLHQWAMPSELPQRDGGVEVRCELARQGLAIAPGRGARELLATYLQVWPIDDRARCVDRLGWHGPVYVLPAAAIGEAGEKVVFQNAHNVAPAFSVADTANEWREHVAAFAQGNSRMMFAISAAFAGTLLDPAGEDSGGFHFRGGSSTGKTTALRLAASVWGDPTKYCRNWRTTTNGLEGLAALHNDGLLILDELNQIDAKEAGEAAYLLANGWGKARAARNGTARPSASWRLLFLSAGEQSLSTMMALAGRRSTAGQEIRMAETDADAGAGMGAFEVLNGFETPAALALALKDAVGHYYGSAGEAWLSYLVPGRAKLADFITDGVGQFVKEHLPEDAAGQVERVARRFGLVAVAGEIATHAGLTGWNEGEAGAAAGKCFASWLDSFGGPRDREDRALLAQVRDFLERHGASRFEDVNATEGQRIINNRAGFFRSVDGGKREYLVFPETFKKEVCSGVDPKAAVRALLAHGWLVPGSDGKATQKPRLPEMGPARVYVIGGGMGEVEE